MSQQKKAEEHEIKYIIQKSPLLGRYLVSTKALEAGEQILTELPFVVGPKASTYPICLACYSPWRSTKDSQPLCSRCSWPVCSAECENDPQHRDNECKIFADVKEKFSVEACKEEEYKNNGVPQLECITPLRLLLASEKDAERWKSEVKDMEAHNKKRSQKAQWNTDHVNIVEYVRKRLKLQRFSEESIQTACGILDVNCHEIRTAKGFNARALYPTVAIMNHSCVSNTAFSVCPISYRVYLRAAVNVSAGGELFGSYAHALLPTMLRREHLLESKYFECTCSRCADPTELGSHMSSVKCNACDAGFVVPLDSLDTESEWKCTTCTVCEFSANAMQKVQKLAHQHMKQVESYIVANGQDAIQMREFFIKKYRSYLHPRHAFLTVIRYSLSQLYGRVEEYMLDDLPNVLLRHKEEMCRQVLQVLDIVEPGMTRSRGMILYELHKPLLLIAKDEWSAGMIDDAGLKSNMIEAATVLKEAVDILVLEPEGTLESEIAKGAKQSLTQLQQSINDL